MPLASQRRCDGRRLDGIRGQKQPHLITACIRGILRSLKATTTKLLCAILPLILSQACGGKSQLAVSRTTSTDHADSPTGFDAGAQGGGGYLTADCSVSEHLPMAGPWITPTRVDEGKILQLAFRVWLQNNDDARHTNIGVYLRADSPHVQVDDPIPKIVDHIDPGARTLINFPSVRLSPELPSGAVVRFETWSKLEATTCIGPTLSCDVAVDSLDR